MDCIKHYLVNFITSNGNGWAIINATNPKLAEDIFKQQTAYECVKVTTVSELRWFGDTMQLVSEGTAITKGNPSIILGTMSPNKTTFNTTGSNKVLPNANTLYLDTRTNILYRWDKGKFIEIVSDMDSLDIDETPKEDSEALVTSGGVYDALKEKQGKLTFDNTPTENSTNPVTSGGIYNAIEDISIASKSFVVTITSTTNNGVTTYHSDKTIAEILAAYQAGQQVIAVDNDSEGGILALTACTNTAALFEGTLASANQMVGYEITGNGITYTVSELQSELVSGTNIKTINGSSVLGSGDLSIAEEQLPNKTYAPAEFSGLGRKYLQKNIVSDKNILTQAMFQDGSGNALTNTIYVIQYDYDLNGQSVTIPSGCVLQFEGGSVSNGTLAGELKSREPLDLKHFGVKYGSASYAASNTNALKILSGITNDITLHVSGEVWLGGQTSISMKSINLEGNGNTIHIDGFAGFTVSGGVNVHNCRIVTDVWANASTYFNTFVSVSNVTAPIKFRMDSNYFSGSMRICSGYDVASGSEVDNEIFTDYNICYESITITNNVFEEIGCLNTSNILFLFTDSNCKTLNFENNKLHNFYSNVCAFGATNDTVYETYLADFYANIGRTAIFRNNVAYNDMDFKPWTKTNVYPYYFTLCTVEYGYCLFADNTIRNIIGNQVDNPTYSAYLSCDVVDFSNNIIDNVINLAGAYNELLKSKSGGTRRIYKNNVFTIDDLSDYFDGITISTHYVLVSTNGLIKNYNIESNIFNLHNLRFNRANALETLNLFVCDNVFNIDNAVCNTTGNDSALFSLAKNANHEQAFIKNNRISVDTYVCEDGVSTPSQPSLFGAYQSAAGTCHVDIADNVLKNVVLHTGTSTDAIKLSGTCNGNSLTINTLQGNYYILEKYASNIAYSNNKVDCSNVSGARMCLYSSAFKDFFVKVGGNISLFEYKAADSFKAVVEVYDESKVNRLLLSEFDCVNDTYTYVDSQTGEVTTASSGNTFAYNFERKTNHNYDLLMRISDKTVSFERMASGTTYYIKFAISPISASSLIYKRSFGSTAQRPTSAMQAVSDQGFKYFDTTLGLEVVWNGTGWIVLPKYEVVSALPASPDSNTLYLIEES